MAKKILVIFVLLLSFLLPLTGSAFSDVPANHPYQESIQYLERRGIVTGDTFHPETKLTREEFAKWVLKNTGFSGEQYQKKTKRRLLDVKAKNNPYVGYIYRLADLGALEIFNEKNPLIFNPKKLVTRREAIELIFFVEGIPVPKIFDEGTYRITDLPAESKFAPLAHKAHSLEMLKPGKAKLSTKINRELAAYFLKQAHESKPTLTVTVLPSLESDLARNPKYDILLGAWNKIFQSYLHRDDLNKDALLFGAIEGMVKELGDKNSDFERPGDNALLDSLSGEVEGIGAVIHGKDGEIIIVSPIAGSPAEKAGLLPGDIITAVDNDETKGKKLSEVVSRIRGKKGTEVKITVRRDGKKLDYVVKRDVVKVVSASLEVTTDNIAVITLRDFGVHSHIEFQEIVKKLVEKRPAGIVLDVRNNPGGYLDKAIVIGGFFIKKGHPVAVIRYTDHEDIQNSNGEAELAGIKTVVLTNGGSASASEILAGALQDYGIAKVVGEKSYGKGTVQELSDFSDGSTLKITVAEWLTPKKRSIEKNGIVPDIEVKLGDTDRAAGKDPQMEKAMEEVKK